MAGSKRLIRGTPSKGVYELRVYAGRDPLTGKECRISRVHEGGVRSADAALRELVEEANASTHRGASPSMARLLADWLDHIRREGRSPTTLREYRRLVDKVIVPALGRLDAAKLTARHLDALYASLSDRGLAPASVRQVHAIVRAACTQGVRWGLLAANPAQAASPPKIRRKREVTAPTVAQVRRMIEAASTEDPDLAALIALAAVTGARRGELLGLQWGDVDFLAGTLLIARSVSVLERGHTTIKEPKTNQARRIALDPFAVELLKRHRAMMTERAHDIGVRLTDDGPIFTYDLERPISPDTVTHYVRNLGRRLGLDVHLHSLRHFAATEMIGSGHDVRTVAGRLGHSDATTTLRTYAHVLPQRDREAAASLGSAFSL